MPRWRHRPRRPRLRPSTSRARSGPACEPPYVLSTIVAASLLLPCSLLLERIVFNAHEIGCVVLGGRVWAAPFRVGGLLHARSANKPWMAVVSFDAARLVIEPVVLVALLCELLLDGPGPGPHGRIFDRNDVFKRVRPGPLPALDQVQVLARALVIGLRAEVGHVNDERVAFPGPRGVAVPLADAGRQVRAPVHHDVALPALALPHIIEVRDTARRLHAPAEAAGRGSKLGQPERQAAVRQRAILRTVMAIDADRVVAGGGRGEPRGGRRVILPAGASH